MAQVTNPIVLDSTAQSTNTKLDTLNSNMASLISAVNGQAKISSGTTELQDGVSSLPSGQVYLWYQE